MKLQANELPLMKPQNRRKNAQAKIAPLIALALFLLTIIPIYYPFLRFSSKNSSEPSTSSLVSSPLCPDGESPENGLCKGNKEEQPAVTSKSESDNERDAETIGGDSTVKPAGGDSDAETVARDRDPGPKPNPNTEEIVETKPITQRDDGPVAESLPRDTNPEAKTNSNQEEVVETKPITQVNGDLATTNPGGEAEELPAGDFESNNGNSETTIIGMQSAGDSETRNDDVPTTAAGENYDKRPGGKDKEQAKAATRPVIIRPAAQNCDIFTGEWVENAEAPYYTNNSCLFIQEHQNCMKFGKPGVEYLKWKWKPMGCELPVFDPFEFLEVMKGKSLAFVGDSVARNHMQSLICLLSRAEEPVDVSEVPFGSQFKRYEYRNSNFTIEIFWSPYLVRTSQTDPVDATRPFILYLDEFDEKWTTKIHRFDYVIVSAGHWFFRPTMFYLEGKLAGCLYCPDSNVPHLTSYFSYRRAFRTAFRAITALDNYKGLTLLRTFAPSHFEGGYWDQGGDCARTRPFGSETRLEGYNMEFYKIQLDELRIAERFGRRKGLKFRLFDVTKAMLLRPDGHPSKYGHWPKPNVTMVNDCVHWCLPGPIDTWNDFLLELLRRER
ncbi:hypothetical protein NMG60_11006239 [Bertholletia excelsa]